MRDLKFNSSLVCDQCGNAGCYEFEQGDALCEGCTQQAIDEFQGRMVPLKDSHDYPSDENYNRKDWVQQNRKVSV